MLGVGGKIIEARHTIGMVGSAGTVFSGSETVVVHPKCTSTL